MNAIVFLALGIALMSSVVTLHRTSAPPRTTHEGSLHALTDHFLTYAWAVGRYVGTRESSPGVPERDYTAPFANNTIPNAELTFPASYSIDNRWSNVVVGGWVTVYTAAPLDPRLRIDFSQELTRRSDGSHGVGVVSNASEIVSLRHGPTGFFVPAAVPAGAIVMHYKSH